MNENPANGVPPVNDDPPVAPTPTVPATPVMPTVTPVVPTPAQSKPSSTMWLYVVLVLFVIFLLGAIGYMLILQKNTQVKTTATPTTNTIPTPQASPVTQSNVDQTLSTTDTSVGTSIDQANTDLSQLSTINSSQDSTTGL